MADRPEETPRAAGADRRPGGVPRRLGCGRLACAGCGSLVLFVVVAVLAIWLSGRADVAPPADADLRVQLPALPAEDNGLHWVETAAGRLQEAGLAADLGALNEQWTPWLEHIRGGADAADEWDAAAVAKALAAAAPALEALDRAQRCERAAMYEVVPATEIVGPGLMDTRVVAALRLLQAEQQRRAGDPGAALETLDGLGRLSSRMATGPATLIQYLVGSAITAEALTAIRAVAADPAATPAQLEAAADRLPAWGRGAEPLRNALRAEYSGILATLDAIEAGKMAAPGARGGRLSAGFAYHPNRTRQLIAVQFRAMIAAAEGPPSQYPVIQDPMPSGAWGKTKLFLGGNVVGHTLYATMIPGLARTGIGRLERDAHVDLTRCWLLALAHRRRTGTLPPSLAALQGPHLAAVPADPFDGAPLRYDPATARLWTIGRDERDGGGTRLTALTDPQAKAAFNQPDPTLRIPD